MSITVNSAQAEKILRSAIAEVSRGNWSPIGPQSQLIEDVILGKHLTYRYILTTAILSKSTNTNCNPLALQAGSSLTGAYDARSICHGVLVPIERELLGGKLGESNEPFLNKPARYPELSTSNAVRRGNDSILLNKSIEVLSALTSAEHAYQCLKDCIYFIFQRQSRNLTDYLSPNTTECPQSSFIEFANLLISESFEGESCALLVGLTYNILGYSQTRTFNVRVHKVNQAGSSSNEISDIDVYEKNTLVHTIEVKDKQFTPEDVEHAIRKAVLAGSYSLVFAVGPRGVLQGSAYRDLIRYWTTQGVNLYFVEVMSLFVSILSTSPNITQAEFLELINYHANQAKVKDDTFNHIIHCTRKLGW